MKTHSNLNVVKTLLSWLQQGESVWLSSITKTWGSSPMPAGTMMAFSTKFGMIGSLSGGCIEQDLVEKFQNDANTSNLSHPKLPIEIVYGENEAQQKRYLLPCGGQLHLLIEDLEPTVAVINHFSQLAQTLLKRELVGRRVSLQENQLEILSQVPKTQLKRGIRRHQDYVEHVMGPEYQMLLIGASEVARCVAELAQPLDFKVSVWDHREEFLQNWQVENVEVFKGSPEKLIQENFHDENNAIIALAHDPRVDDFALVDALATKAFYIGAIGSKKTCSNRYDRLCGYIEDKTSLDKLHSPVGISIGSKTPFEIAISIMAEVILKRSQLEKSVEIR